LNTYSFYCQQKEPLELDCNFLHSQLRRISFLFLAVLRRCKMVSTGREREDMTQERMLMVSPEIITHK
jgi:hypothetical protein